MPPTQTELIKAAAEAATDAATDAAHTSSRLYTYMAAQSCADAAYIIALDRHASKQALVVSSYAADSIYTKFNSDYRANERRWQLLQILARENTR